MATTGPRNRGGARRGVAEPGQRATPAETRQTILQAAKQRFLHYGYKKTTIDEIAADAGVGKGTVYLYFDGKDEIMLTLVLEVKRHITEQMRAVAAGPASAPDKLRQMLLACILTVFDACTATAHGKEFVDDLRLQLISRPEWLEQFVKETATQRDMVADVLREGHKSRIFDVADPAKAAHLLMTAFAAFFPPYAHGPCAQVRTRDEIEAGAREMIDFVQRGLQRCR